MTLYKPCALRIVSTPMYRPRWQQLCLRRYTTGGTSDPEWFRRLADEMRRRQIHPVLDHITDEQEKSLRRALTSFVPSRWLPKRPEIQPLPLGHHLVYFNHEIPASKLLPDGTDTLHSPGEPFVRRMWAGGTLRVDVQKHFTGSTKWVTGDRCRCAERIKDVQLRGQGDTEKIYVTIERKIAKFRNGGVLHGDIANNDAAWEDATMVEERNLVFMKARTLAELEAIKAGTLAPVRYIQPPGEPDFSHSLTPTSVLLSRFSDLTSNAHAIHLDPEYARKVEGHRNLLVHGPLSLTLILAFVNARLERLSGPRHVIQSITYRNLAPLYCNEEMRLCGREIKQSSSEDAKVYDVWIEGPTGGMAFKGKVGTALIPVPEKAQHARRFESSKAQSKGDEAVQDHDRRGGVSRTATSTERSSKPVRRVESRQGNREPQIRSAPLRSYRTIQGFARKSPSDSPPEDTTTLSRRERRRIRARRLRIPILRRIHSSPTPMEAQWSLVQRNLAYRLSFRERSMHTPSPFTPRYISPIRTYRTSKQHVALKDEDPVASSPFARRGVKKISQVVVRKTGDTTLETASRHKRKGDFWGGWRKDVPWYYHG